MRAHDTKRVALDSSMLDWLWQMLKFQELTDVQKSDSISHAVLKDNKGVFYET